MDPDMVSIGKKDLVMEKINSLYFLKGEELV